MKAASSWGRGLAAPALVIALSGLACDRPPDQNPSADSARSGLEKVLGAWKDGKPQASLAGGDPPIQVVDSDWAGGKTLTSYEILREEPSTADKRFVVKLGYASPRAEVETVYIVLGARPLSVFREDDYNRSMNMDNTATPKKKR